MMISSCSRVVRRAVTVRASSSSDKKRAFAASSVPLPFAPNMGRHPPMIERAEEEMWNLCESLKSRGDVKGEERCHRLLKVFDQRVSAVEEEECNLELKSCNALDRITNLITSLGFSADLLLKTAARWEYELKNRSRLGKSNAAIDESRLARQRHITAAFKAADVNRDGVLQVAEARAFLQALGHESAEKGALSSLDSFTLEEVTSGTEVTLQDLIWLDENLNRHEAGDNLMRMYGSIDSIDQMH